MDQDERRRSPRRRLPASATVRAVDAADPVDGYVINASRDGLYVLVHAAGFSVGDEVNVTIAARPDLDLDAFASTATIVRIDEVMMAGTEAGAEQAYDVALELADPLPL